MPRVQALPESNHCALGVARYPPHRRPPGRLFFIPFASGIPPAFEEIGDPAPPGLVAFLLSVAAGVGALVFWLATNSPSPTTFTVGPVQAWEVPGGVDLAVTDGHATHPAWRARHTLPNRASRRAACWEIVARR